MPGLVKTQVLLKRNTCVLGFIVFFGFYWAFLTFIKFLIAILCYVS